MSFLRRRILTAALVANALWPAPGFRGGIASFVPGWVTTELAPHLFAATAADTAAHALWGGSRDERGRRTGRSGLGLALGTASLAGLGVLLAQSQRVRQDTEAALATGLGADYRDQLEEQPTPADLALPWRSLVNPFRVRSVAVHVDRDIAYAPEHGRRGMLDVYRPAEGDLSGAPVLVQVHGGGWTIGSKEQQGVPLMHHLAAKGWVCVALNYRLAPRSHFPAQIIDVKRALAWVKDHIAEYGGDPEYVAITGGSAGGHLAALAALTPGDPAYQPGFEDADTSVQVAVPHYGVYDFAASTGLRSAELMRDRFLAPRVVGRSYAEAPEIFEAGSPLLRITPDAPDFLVIHGTHDGMVAVDQARLFVERLRETGEATVTYVELPGAQHAFDLVPSIRSTYVVQAIDRYLHWHWNRWRRARAGDVA